MHAPHGSAACSQCMVNLDDVPARSERLQFLDAEEALQIAPAVAYGFALQNPQVESVDINPLLAGPGVCMAVDALVVLRHDGTPALPIPADPPSPVLHAAPAAQVGAHHSRSER